MLSKRQEELIFHGIHHFIFEHPQPVVKVGISSHWVGQIHDLSVFRLNSNDLMRLLIKSKLINAFKKGIDECLILALAHLANKVHSLSEDFDEFFVGQEVESWEIRSFLLQEVPETLSNVLTV